MTYTGCTVEASEGVPAVSLAENIIAEFDRALDEAQFRLEVIESLRDWVEETSRVRAGGNSTVVNAQFFRRNPQVDDVMQSLTTLRSVAKNTELFLTAGRQMQGVLLPQDYGHSVLRHESTETHGISLMALGLASGDPEAVFVGRANRLLGEAIVLEDPVRAEALAGLLRELADNPCCDRQAEIAEQIPRALARLEQMILTYQQIDGDAEQKKRIFARLKEDLFDLQVRNGWHIDAWTWP